MQSANEMAAETLVRIEGRFDALAAAKLQIEIALTPPLVEADHSIAVYDQHLGRFLVSAEPERGPIEDHRKRRTARFRLERLPERIGHLGR